MFDVLEMILISKIAAINLLRDLDRLYKVLLLSLRELLVLFLEFLELVEGQFGM
jgi:hypothetical protein